MAEHYNKYLVKVATLAGITMLESNAESYRVENTVSRILQVSKQPITEVFANTTGLFITLDGPELDEPITLIKRISQRTTNLRKIHIVNQISRDLTNGLISLEEAHQQLLNIDKCNYSKRVIALSTLLLVLSFAILLGGDINEIILSLVAAVLLLLSYRLKALFQLNDFIFGTVATFIVALVIPIIIHFLGKANPSFDIVVISVLMPLFPGTAFTNGFRDSFKGDYGAGLTKIVEALIIAVSLGVGVALGLFVAKGIIEWV
ncbi:threonine/serine exporter family protein [Streptococcus didelphis]|uniref:Threonine/serine exporter family protein n=1 Tax=Streptococcus didelphis TaxID=102886 RepID=A0ABY9LHG1_9STRE|nr:threonine/serine exporter family protein [Streptococcus didelphis]WMB28283.1 threonine/serine exporter family protein [Streptococcus didelphis]WMB28956.1 threonine/serine exporter family protein [Streptococcus didelphis]